MAGAGKTTIGKKLAKILSLNFLDGDKIIEGEINESIQKFIDQKGREEFTKIEESVLLSIKFDETLLATGGSAILCDSAMQFMKIYPNELQISPKEALLGIQIKAFKRLITKE